MKFHPKDSMTFKVIDTNPAKGTVTLMPTFGTLIKFNIAAGAIMYCAARIARVYAEDHRPAVRKDENDNDTTK